MFGNVRSSGTSRVMPNGVDFWWDEFAGNTRNCWFSNKGPNGGGVTGPGAGSPPDPLPSNCNSSGLGRPAKLAIELDCADGPDEETGPLDCPWWQIPPSPPAARRASATRRSAAPRSASRAVTRPTSCASGSANCRGSSPCGRLPCAALLLRVCWPAVRGQRGPRQGPSKAACAPRWPAPPRRWPTAASGSAPRPSERRVTVEDLRGQLTEQSSKSAKSVLSDERAYELFEHACKQDYAD